MLSALFRLFRRTSDQPSPEALDVVRAVLSAGGPVLLEPDDHPILQMPGYREASRLGLIGYANAAWDHEEWIVTTPRGRRSLSDH